MTRSSETHLLEQLAPLASEDKIWVGEITDVLPLANLRKI